MKNWMIFVMCFGLAVSIWLGMILSDAHLELIADLQDQVDSLQAQIDEMKEPTKVDCSI